jgi:hypothetical protein
MTSLVDRGRASWPGRSRGPVAALAVFIVLTAFMMWPQVRRMTDSATEHQDVYFNMWRLAWIAHALSSSPSHLLDGNIFYPERRTLTFSDAMLVEGAVAAPLIWIGVKPVLVHNLMMLGAIAVSALGLYMLVLYLTGSRGGALLAGVIFAFVPYRYEHIMHMELQWTMWMPWTFLALHRTLDTGRWRYGIATGLALALQMLSSIYYGIFLATLLAFSAVFFLICDRAVSFRRAVAPLAAGAVAAGLICGIYGRPYLRTRDVIGERPDAEVMTYSAQPASYLAATPTNWLYGGTMSNRGGPERRLFPGAAAVLLAMIGLLLPSTPSRRQIVYLLAMVAAFEMSLGFRGYSYTVLHHYVSVFRGLRAPARLGIFVAMFLGVLAAYGYTAIATSLAARHRRVLLAGFLAVMLAEYRAAMPLVRYQNGPSGVYRVLVRQQPGPVVEFPLPRDFPGRDAEYAYMSTFHWMPLLNGYSGMFPKSYLMSLARLRSFPHEEAIGALRRTGIRYVIVHSSSYKPAEFDQIRLELARQRDVAEIGLFQDPDGPAALYVLP